MDMIAVLLLSLAGSLPALIAAMAGVVVACVFWSAARRPAVLLLLASLLELSTLLAGSWFRGVYLSIHLHAGDMTSIDLARLSGLVGLVFSILHGAVLGLLIWAVVADRGQRVASPPSPRL